MESQWLEIQDDIDAIAHQMKQEAAKGIELLKHSR
jgi:hypothetical protein